MALSPPPKPPRSWYSQIPDMVTLQVESPYELALFTIYQRLYGKFGVAILSTRDLATLTHMSKTTISICRNSLMRKGFIVGEFTRDARYQQPVWHVRIPDNLWERNAEFIAQLPTVKDWVRYAEDPKRFDTARATKGPPDVPPDEDQTDAALNKEAAGALDGDPDPRSGGSMPPDGQGVTCSGAGVVPDEQAVMLNGPIKSLVKTPIDTSLKPGLLAYPPDVRETIREFAELWALDAPTPHDKISFTDWVSGARELQAACAEIGPKAIQLVHDDWSQRLRDDGRPPFPVSRPRAIVKTVRAKIGVLRQAASHPQNGPAPELTAEERAARVRALLDNAENIGDRNYEG